MNSSLKKILILIPLFISILWYGCNEKEDPKPVIYNIPIVSVTNPVLDITGNTARSGGTISADGGTKILSRGLCWNITGNPTVSDKITANTTGLGSFESELKFLYPNTTYFVKAFAVNAAGFGYGPEVSFKTPIIPGTCKTDTALSVDSTSARLGGVITDGGQPYTNHGICFSERISPTIEFADSIFSFGAGQGRFSGVAKGFKPFKKYFFRAFGINAAGTIYGEEYSFTTKDLLPGLITTEATNVFSDSVTLGGTVTYSGGEELVVRGVCWSLKSNPEANNNLTRRSEQTKNTGTFSFNITRGITPDTIWYARAYARTRSGLIQYGQNVTFTTPKRIPLLLNVVVAGFVDSARVTLRIDPGSGTLSQLGVYYGVNPNPDASANVVFFPNPGSITGIKTIIITLYPLVGGTVYYFKPFATNEIGTTIRPDANFTTLSIPPTLTTKDITEIAETTANVGGNISYIGNPPFTERGVCYDTLQNPTISQNPITVSGTEMGDFSVQLTGLLRGKTYNVRAYAKVGVVVFYGDQKSFSTLP